MTWIIVVLAKRQNGVQSGTHRNVIVQDNEPPRLALSVGQKTKGLHVPTICITPLQLFCYSPSLWWQKLLLKPCSKKFEALNMFSQGKYLWSTTQFHMKVCAFDELWVAECVGESHLPARSHLCSLQITQWM
jgi:hypothetical protein